MFFLFIFYCSFSKWFIRKRVNKTYKLFNTIQYIFVYILIQKKGKHNLMYIQNNVVVRAFLCWLLLATQIPKAQNYAHNSKTC